jgi:hypothetical protein
MTGVTTTIVARIARVITGSATATMVHAIADDLDIKLEVSPGQARALVPGQVLVVQWSAHSVPELSSPELATPASIAIDPLDHEFDIRINNTPAPAVGARDILDEFNALLGAPRRKG